MASNCYISQKTHGMVDISARQILSNAGPSSLISRVATHLDPWGAFVYFFCQQTNNMLQKCRNVISQHLKCCSWEPRSRRLCGRASQDLRFLVHDSRSVITSKNPQKTSSRHRIVVYCCNFWGRKYLGKVSSGQ